MNRLTRWCAILVFSWCAACSNPFSNSPQRLDAATREYLGQFAPFSNILSVDRFIPPAPGGNELVLHFSQPMAALPEVGAEVANSPVSIVPAVPGRFEWISPKTFIFVADAPFTAGMRHEVVVKAGSESLAGTVLVKDASFGFTAAAGDGRDADRMKPVIDEVLESTPSRPPSWVGFGDMERPAFECGDRLALELLEEGVDVAISIRFGAKPPEIGRAASPLSEDFNFSFLTDSATLYARLERVVSLPFRANLDVPAIVRVGDRFLARAVVVNKSDRAVEALATWKAGGFVGGCGESASRLSLPPGGETPVLCYFSADETALEAAGHEWTSRTGFAVMVPVALTLADETASATETAFVSARNGRFVVETASGLADPEAIVEFEKPAETLDGFGGLDLRIENRGSRDVTSAKVFLNGERIILSSLDPLRPEDGVFIPIAKLPGNMSLGVSRRRGAFLSYRFALSYALPAPPVVVEDKGMEVSREIRGNGRRAREGLVEGIEYDVRVSVYLAGDAGDLSVRDDLPAGVSLVAIGRAALPVEGGVEFRPGAVRSGLARFSYRVRAERPGTYAWPRTVASDRGNSQIRGTSGYSHVEIR